MKEKIGYYYGEPISGFPREKLLVVIQELIEQLKNQGKRYKEYRDFMEDIT